ncbi:MAG: hypothetical protein CMF69_00585 [Magnetovibrio sp.]|nr:hypothetical protein [Magnetovibrio sp.]|tara:strand:- start:5 stop:457 length:453 start_codon:yes stop_codon:yes gene_type:complete
MQTEVKYPGTFSIYKKTGAAQFTLMMPRVNDKGRIDKNGAVLLEVASSSGEKSYDWQTKISFAIGMSDLSNIMESPDSPAKLIHTTPNSNSIKSLEFIPGEGKYVGTFMMKISEKSGDDKWRNISVPLSSGEYTVLLRLLMSAAPTIIGW